MYPMYPFSFWAGAPGQILSSEIRHEPEWRRDFFGNVYVGYRQVAFRTVSRGPWLPPIQVRVAN